MQCIQKHFFISLYVALSYYEWPGKPSFPKCNQLLKLSFSWYLNRIDSSTLSLDITMQQFIYQKTHIYNALIKSLLHSTASFTHHRLVSDHCSFWLLHLLLNICSSFICLIRGDKHLYLMKHTAFALHNIPILCETAHDKNNRLWIYIDVQSHCPRFEKGL